MHPSALKTGQLFFETYARHIQSGHVVDLGAQDVNGSLKSVCPAHMNYSGVDFVPGKGVDVVLEDPYRLPFQDNSVDMLVSSSCFEHSEMFWILFLEILRVLKPSGIFYLNAPSNGVFHRYPVDCWRFYPDSGIALVNWARRNQYDPLLLESFISGQDGEPWNDFVAVFVKEKSSAFLYPGRIASVKADITNGRIAGKEEFVNYRPIPQDLEKLDLINKIVLGQIKSG